MESKHANYVIENNILKGRENPSLEMKYPKLAETILNNLSSYPDFVGQIDAVTGEEWKYKKMHDRSVRCALWMKVHGLFPKDVVMICTHNHMDAAMPLFATLFLGGIVNPLDTGLHKSDFRHLMNITKPKIAFVSEQVATTIAQVAEDMKLELKIVVFGRLPGFCAFSSIIAEARDDEIQNFECTPLENPDQIVVLKCSSGTTGPPKVIALSNSTLLNVVMRKKYFYHEALIFSPIGWYTGTVYVLISGCCSTRIISPPFEENTACEFIAKYKVNHIFLSPSMINRLLGCDVINKYDLSSLRVVLSSGSNIAVTSRKAFTRLVPNAMLFSMYGMTEVGDVVSRQSSHTKIESSGFICENSQVKVIDLITGETLGPNQQGELLLKTKTMMNGYYNDPQATAELIDKEGWVHSGDLGYFDEDGEVFVIDRLKELIKYRGQNMSAVEIENILLSHPGVKEVAVVGLPHPLDDEHPIAFVVKSDSSVYNEEVTEKELIDFVAPQVSDRKRLRGGVRFVENLPKTESSKIKRRDLRALAKSLMQG